MVVFLILVIINFVVITKGSVRTSEVAARFTLDAIPGKQMGIDADLNAGMINEKEAQSRRKQLEQEADFYGSMDGAIRFVRGDAIAGIIITGVNVLCSKRDICYIENCFFILQTGQSFSLIGIKSIVVSLPSSFSSG